MKRIDLWKLLLVLPLTFTLSTPVFAEDAPAAPEAKETAPAAEEAPDSSDDGEAKEKEEKPKTIADLTEDADRFDGLHAIQRPQDGCDQNADRRRSDQQRIYLLQAHHEWRG